MMFSRPRSELERFCELIEARLGLQCGENRYEALDTLLRNRARTRALDAGGYLRMLETPDARNEWCVLAQQVTVGETYFFRHMEQFRGFSEAALPARLETTKQRRLRILSAGCASGEEAYTLAMLIIEAGRGPGSGWDVVISGVDINAAALEKARAGSYPSWALRETPPAMMEKYFHKRGDRYLVDERVRAMVRFEEHNLAADGPTLARAGSHDIIFCRNVLMYFGDETMRRAVANLARALLPEGYLFIGHAESLRGISADYDLCHTHGAFYYRRRTNTVPQLPAVATPPPALLNIVVDGHSWAETIRLSTQQVAALASPIEANESAPSPPWDLRAAITLMQNERYADALATMKELPAAAERDVDVLLLRAVLLTHVGELDQAAQACLDILELDGLNASAQYVLALCHEAAGDLRAAQERDLLATHLDADFAMPHLHLGLLARRRGDAANARRELEHAAMLLQREEPARLLLFGGGFGRSALLSLCRAELEATQTKGAAHG